MAGACHQDPVLLSCASNHWQLIAVVVLVAAVAFAFVEKLLQPQAKAVAQDWEAGQICCWFPCLGSWAIPPSRFQLCDWNTWQCRPTKQSTVRQLGGRQSQIL